MSTEMLVPPGQSIEQKLLWELYRGWQYHAAEYADAEGIREMLAFYAKLQTLLAGSETERVEGRAEFFPIVPEDMDPQAFLQLLIVVLRPGMVFQVTHKNTLGEVQRGYVDFLFIISSGDATPFAEYEHLLDLIVSGVPGMSFTLYKQEFLNYALQRGVPYLSWACIEENLVYSNGSMSLTKQAPESAESMLKKATDNFFTSALRAQSFLSCAEQLFETRQFDIAMFHIHQAIELIYRGIAMALLGADKSVHSIKTLKRIVRRVAPQLTFILPEDTEHEQHLMKILDEAYIDGRYKTSYEVGEQDVRHLLNKAHKLVESAAHAFERRMQVFRFVE